MILLEIFAKTKILAVIFDNTVIQRYNFLFSESNSWDRQTGKNNAALTYFREVGLKLTVNDISIAKKGLI